MLAVSFHSVIGIHGRIGGRPLVVGGWVGGCGCGCFLRLFKVYALASACVMYQVEGRSPPPAFPAAALLASLQHQQLERLEEGHACGMHRLKCAFNNASNARGGHMQASARR